MIANFQKAFNQTATQMEAAKEKYELMFAKLAKEQGCSTCKHCKPTGRYYPNYVTAEHNYCDAGLECDTVLFTVKNCPKWEIGEL